MFIISTILVSCAPCPWAPCSDLPRLLLCSGGLFAAFFGSSSSWSPSFVVWSFVCVFMVWAVLSLPLVCPCFVSLFPRAWLLFVVLFVVFVLLPAFLWCLFLWPLCASLSVVGSFAFVLSWLLLALLPVSCCLPPPVVGPCGVLALCLCWSLPLVSGCFCDGPVPCLNAWVWWCSVVLSSSCLMAAKAFGPVWGLFYPLHHVAGVVAVLCTPTLRYSSADDPSPHWTPLSYTVAIFGKKCGLLRSCPLLPSRRPLFLLLVCLWMCSLFCLSFLLFFNLPCLTEALEVWSSDCCESLLGLFVYVVSGCCISGKGTVALAKVTRTGVSWRPRGPCSCSSTSVFDLSRGRRCF